MSKKKKKQQQRESRWDDQDEEEFYDESYLGSIEYLEEEFDMEEEIYDFSDRARLSSDSHFPQRQRNPQFNLTKWTKDIAERAANRERMRAKDFKKGVLTRLTSVDPSIYLDREAEDRPSA